jgi:CRP-like cAMP-binding protein
MSLVPLVNRLSKLATLTQQEKQALLKLPFVMKQIVRYRDAIVKGDEITYLYVVLDGWAGRYNIRPDGSRRITGFLVPGDFCGIHAVCHAPMDHSITALTKCTIAKIEIAKFNNLAAGSPEIAKAIWIAKLGDEAILRTWLLNSADALKSLTHLLCEFEARLDSDATSCERAVEFPLTQEQLGDALGITKVHVNRTLRQLRERGLATIQQGKLYIPDVTALRKRAGFDPSYLHGCG